MSIKFVCVQCERMLQVDDELGGNPVTCPECGTVMTAPMAGTPAPNRQSSFGPPQQAGGFPGIRTETAGQTRRHVPNYLVQAILCTLFCCLPFGIVAILFAAQVNGHLSSGNYRAAQAASNNARTWCWAAFGCGLAWIVIWMFAFVMSLAL